MKREEVRKRIQEIGIVAAVRQRSTEDAAFAAETVFHSGIPIVEIALTLPGATEVISDLAGRFPDLIVGAGSVLDAEMAQASLDAGAQFLTSDGLHLDMTEFAAKNDVVVFPGALTPTEVIAAWKAGCDFVKVVPCAQIGGGGYLASLHQMFPQMALVAAGGVNQQNAATYVLDGAVALGIGGELIPSRAIRHREPNEITERAHRFLDLVKNARKHLRDREAEVNRTTVRVHSA